MTKQQWINAKTAYLIHNEKYKPDQAYAIAHSLAEKEYHGMQKAQEGTYYQNNNIFGTQNPGQQFPQNMYVPQNQQGIMLDPNDMSQETYKPDAELRNRAQYNKWINSQTNNYDENGNAIDTSNFYQDYMRLKIANPYTGVDPMARLYWSGMQFGQGNTGAGILGAVGGGLGLARTFMSGLGAGKENQRQEADMRYQLYGKQPNYEYGQTGNNATYVFQEGGKITNADLMTGHFLTDMPNPNLEIEKNEQVKNSQTGQIQKAVGATHEDGGIKVNLPDNSKVLSDFTKIGAENAKKFQKQFDIAFKASHTFADVMDKVNNKIGLTKLIEEEKEYSEKVEKQLKSSIDEATKKVNLNFLSKEIEKLEKKKEMLKPIQDRIFEDIFAQQEKIPKKSDGYTLLKQEGGGVQNQQPSPEEIITAFSQLTGQDPQEIIAQLQQMQPEEQNQALQQMVAALQQGQQNPQEEQMEGQMSNPQEEQQEMPVAQEGTQVNPYLQNSTLISDFTNTPKTLENLPYTPRDTNSNEIWKGNNYENIWKPLVEKSLSNPEQAKKIDNWLTANKDKFAPNIQKQLEGLTGEKRIEKIKYLATDKFPGLFHNAVLEAIKTTSPTKVKEATKKAEEQPITKEEQAKKSRMVEKTVTAQIPFNFILPPDALQTPANFSYNASRKDSIKGAIDPYLVNSAANFQALVDSMTYAPENQRAAVLASGMASQQASANQAIGAVTQANTQQQKETDDYNASQADKEQLMNINLKKDYETKASAAVRNTGIDWRRYFNQLNQENRQKFLDISALNMLNQVTPNYQSNGADIFFNNASANVSNSQADPEVMQIYKETEGNPALRAKYLASLTEYRKSKQS